MILTDFAPNEKFQDSLTALKNFFLPWKWHHGGETAKLKQRIRQKFFSSDTSIHFYLSGRSALYYFLKSLSLQPNTEILVQAFTCAAVVLPIQKLGLKPVYIDINSDDYSMNIQDFKKKLTTKIKVLILQHTYGITPKSRTEILDLAKENNIVVIEDIAHGADFTLFKSNKERFNLLMSFGRSKFISSVFGGAIVTKYKRLDANLHEIDKNLKNPRSIFLIKLLLYKFWSFIITKTYSIGLGKLIHGIARFLGIFTPEVTKLEKKGFFDLLFLKSFPNICAIFLLSQFQTFNDVVKKRTVISNYYGKSFNSKIKDLALIRYPFCIKDRSQFIAKAKKKGMMFGQWYDQIVGPQSFDMSKTNYKKGSCPVAEKIVNEVVNLPTQVSLFQASKIVDLVKNQT
ncbi:hypothetical protein A3F59_02195 [Candidatus Roizmanbacteria bacterium RIFCSPHIGHO2_12_FULL_38_13]|nr:MAG: hypothetical protein A3F59_02195 [Candidatus Roizmanbacteria bacterium RIFCSPHIGHO2_12_FULL_38_13]